MRRTIQLSLIILLTSVLALAHGKPQKIMGMVKEITATHIVVTTSSGESRNVEIHATTKFLKSGDPAKASDITVGERVVVEADVHEGKLIAETVKFGKPAHAQGH